MIEEQNRQEIVELLNQNVFVEAGAGAGKTTLIVKRIINQLKEGVLPQEIVAITFTKAAAESLKSRITEALIEKCSNDDTLSAEEKERLEAAVKVIDLMNVSTIHSFCFKLLQERIFDAGLSMDITLMDDKETEACHKKFFTKWINSLGHREWDELLQTGEEKYSIANYIKAFFEDICELPDDTIVKYDPNALIRSNGVRERWLVEDFEALLCSSVGELMGKTFNSIAEIPDKNLLKQGKAIKALMTNSNIDYKAVLDEIVKKTTSDKKYINVVTKEFATDKGKDDLLRLDAECRKWGEVTYKAEIDEISEKVKDYKYTLFLTYAIKARECYRKERSKKNISNDDLLQKTCKLICENEAAKNYFANKFKCIYVDEFQDTDSIQEAFIWKLATDSSGEALRDGALFVVGDPKQSIYRFRGAQPEVYFTTKAKMEEQKNAKVYCLDYNFRSNDKIVSWVNSEFKTRDICNNNSYRDMVARKELIDNPPANMLSGIYFYTNPSDATTNIDADAKALRDLIYKLVAKGYKIQDYYDDKLPAEPRCIKYSDFLVLCHNKKQMDQYVNAMAEVGIPVQIYGEFIVTENKALISFVRLFDFLVHPYNRMKKLGAIECLEKNGMPGEKVADWLITETKAMSKEGIVGYLKRSLELLLPHSNTVSESSIQSVQKKLYQMVETVMYNQCSSEITMAEEFWTYINKELEREISLESEKGEVCFMNVHKAKGLEGKIVILTKRDTELQFRYPSYRSDNEYYPTYSSFGVTRWYSYRTNVDVLDAAQEESERENTRLEYVTATRAEQVFIVMDAIKENTMLASYKVKNGNNTVKDIVDDSTAESYISPETVSFTSKDHGITPKVCSNGKKQDESVYNMHKPSDFEETVKAPKLELEDGEIQDKPSGRRPKGPIFGNAMHRSLELLINRIKIQNNCVDIDKSIAVSIGQALIQYEEDIPNEAVAVYKEYLEKMLKAFVKWGMDKGIFDVNKTLYTELPFWYYEESLEESFYMNGFIDLVVKDEQGKYTVYDYKSDRDINLSKEDFIASIQAKYTGQLKQYRKAISKMFDVETAEVELKIISFRGDEELELTVVDIGE